MANNEVPSKYLSIDRNNVYSAEVPSSGDWQRFAKNIAYLKGRGSQLMPAANLADGGLITITHEFQYQLVIFPRQQNLERYWTVQAETSGGVGRLNINIDGDATSITVGTNGAEILLRQSVTQSAHSNITFVSFSGTFLSAPGKINELSCFEAPRIRMDAHNAQEDIPNDASVRNTYPIFADPRNPSIDSVRAIATHVSSSIGVVRRSGLFCWAQPVRVNNNLNTGTFSVTNVLQTTFPAPPRIQARKVYKDETQASVDVYVCAWSGATNTNIECIVSSSIGNAAFSKVLPQLQPTWVSGTVPVRVDGSGSNGLPDGESVSDSLIFRFRNVGNNSRIYISTIVVGESRKPR